MLLCSVRGCDSPLRLFENAAKCDSGHCYDRARSGYFNLLQPQDRRSRNPGDTAQAVAARRRIMENGLGLPLLERLLEIIGARRGSLLDLGCGEGFYAGSIAEKLPIACYGIDISARAIEMAARRYRRATWLVANADRRLPFSTCSLDIVTSITARRNPVEVSRVLRPDGLFVVAVPAPDDLKQLRQHLLGVATELDSATSLVSQLSPYFQLMASYNVSSTLCLSATLLQDLLSVTYRVRQSSRVSQPTTVTSSFSVFAFTPKK